MACRDGEGMARDSTRDTATYEEQQCVAAGAAIVVGIDRTGLDTCLGVRQVVALAVGAVL